LRRGANGDVEAVKYPKDGAGIITSLTETDGLVELDEDTTTVTPGATVGFLSYAAHELSRTALVVNASETGSWIARRP
jgi:Molybdopterin biosynthesis enzyme